MSEVWLDEPPPENRSGRRGKYDWDAIVAALQERPGQWRLVVEGANRGLYSAIKARRMVALQDPDWEFEVRSRNTDRENNTADIWMSATPREEN